MKTHKTAIRLPFSVLVLLLLLLPRPAVEAAEPADDAAEEQIIARVNEAPIYAADLEWQWRRELRRSGEGNLVLDRPRISRAELLEKLIRQELVYLEARKAGIKPDVKQLQAQIEQLKNRFQADNGFYRELQSLGLSEEQLHNMVVRAQVIRRFLEERFVRRQSVTDEEVEAWYRTNRDSLQRPAQACASHILLAVPADADDARRRQARQKLADLRRRWQDGENFAALARAHSDCPSRERDGDLGCFTHRDMVRPFAEAAFALQPGQVSQPVATDQGYHLIQLHRRHGAVTPPSEEIRRQALMAIGTAKAKPLIAAYIEELRENAEVVFSPKTQRPGIEAQGQRSHLESRPLLLAPRASGLAPRSSPSPSSLLTDA